MDILAIIGTSSLVTIVVSFGFDVIKKRMDLRYEKLFLEKESRYRSMLVFMSVLVDSDNYNHIDTAIKPKGDDPKSIQQYYRRELQLHLEFSQLYASKKVVEEIANFLDKPNQINFKNTALVMRQDLWSKGRLD